MSGPLKYSLAGGLLLCIALAFAFPERWLMPGHVTSDHAKIEGDCLACHSLFRGTTADRCIDCHDPRKPAPQAGSSAAGASAISVAMLHQMLPLENCQGCHVGHLTAGGPSRAQRFDHALLPPVPRRECASCHVTPRDDIHPSGVKNCADCHSTARWSPASFDHAKLFPLIGEHAASCRTCHTGKDHSTYTCYGCHEHSPDRIARQHAEEGIQDLRNCVRCHRDGTEHGGNERREGHDD